MKVHCYPGYWLQVSYEKRGMQDACKKIEMDLGGPKKFWVFCQLEKVLGYLSHYLTDKIKDDLNCLHHCFYECVSHLHNKGTGFCVYI